MDENGSEKCKTSMQYFMLCFLIKVCGALCYVLHEMLSDAIMDT